MAFSTPSYGQAGSYTAANDRTLTKANARTAGVRRLIPASAGAMQGDLAVTTTGAGNGSVNVAAGDVWIDDGTGTAFYFSNNGASVVAGPFAANSSGTSRTDLVYVLVTDTGASAPTIAVSIATGSVVVPAKAVGLATVVIPNGFTVSTTVLAANITDVRPKAQVPDLSVTSTSAVASPKSGNVVFDTSTAPQGKLKVYDNSGTWMTVATTSGTGFSNVDMASGYTLLYQNSSAPSSPTDGQLWFNTSTGVLAEYRASDTTWVEVSRTSAWGTWTPTITQGVTVSQSGSSYARWVRHGRTVHVQAKLIGSSAGTSGSAVTVSFTGLPTPTQTGLFCGDFAFLNQGTGWYFGRVRLNTASTLQFYYHGGHWYINTQLGVGGGTVGGAYTTTAVSFGSTDELHLNFSYEANP